MELNERTALVTGGADGIGGGIAERLAAEGMHVVIADLDERTGPITAERIGGSFLRTDLATEGGVRAALDAAGPVGVLVNNADGIEDLCFDDTLAGRIMLCQGGVPARLLPLFSLA